VLEHGAHCTVVERIRGAETSFVCGIVEIVAVQLVSGYQPPHPFEFLGFVIFEGIVILTFALMLSTRVAGMVGGVIAAILFGIAWMGGIVGGVGTAFNNATITHVGTATKLILPTDGLWRGAVWSLEPSIVIAAQQQVGPAVAANPFFAAEQTPLLRRKFRPLLTDGRLDPSIHSRGVGAPLDAGKPALAAREGARNGSNPLLVPPPAYLAQYCASVKPDSPKCLKEKDLSFSARGGICQGIQAVSD